MEYERSSSPAEAGVSSNGTGNSHRRTVTAVKRTYECTFCKRGFTNAQALGGHMNIHRRDRAKAKLSSATTATHYCSSEESEHFYYRNPKPCCNRQICPVSDQVHFPRCFPQASGSDPRLVNDNEQDALSTSLSLRIGSSSGKNENFATKKESFVEGDNDELDLELRLGS